MPEPPIGGVQATELVTVHKGALEMRRPGSWNKALVSGRPPAPTRLSRYFVSAMVTPAFHARSRSGRVKASSSKPWLLTPPRRLPVHAPVNGLLSLSAPFRLSLQLLIVSTTKLRPLKVFNWKSRNTWWNSARFTSIPRPLNLAPISNASLISGLNLRSLPDATIPPQFGCAAETQIEPLPDNGNGCGPKAGSELRNSAERSRLKPPAL